VVSRGRVGAIDAQVVRGNLSPAVAVRGSDERTHSDGNQREQHPDRGHHSREHGDRNLSSGEVAKDVLPVRISENELSLFSQPKGLQAGLEGQQERIVEELQLR
jgi:hypothetical protein